MGPAEIKANMKPEIITEAEEHTETSLASAAVNDNRFYARYTRSDSSEQTETNSYYRMTEEQVSTQKFPILMRRITQPKSRV